MPAKTHDDDFLATIPDPTQTGGRRTAASAHDDNFLDAMPDPIRLATQGVKVAGTNAAGRPIFAPAGQTEPKGSAARRFLSSAVDVVKNAAKGMYHGLVEGPQNPEETQIEAANPFAGRADLIAHRFITGPMKAEANAAKEEFAQSNPWSLHPSQEQIWHREKALGHGLATILPGVGPTAAQAGERVGEQWGTGDIAGALGTLAGNAAMYAAPEVAGKVARSEFISRTIPRGMITRTIRPMAGDLKFGKDPAQAIFDEKITGNTLEDVGNRVSDKLADVGQQLDREAQRPANASKVVDVSGSLRPLDDAMVEAVKAGDRALFAKLREVRTELTQNWKPFRTAKGEVILRPTGPRNMRMSPYKAIQFKRMVGDRIRWTEDPLQDATNKSLGAVYGSVRDATNSAVPVLAELNTRYSNLVGAAKAIQRRLPVEARNAHWSLSDIALGASGHIPLAVARHIARWPAVRTRVAQGLYNAPRAVPLHPALVAGPVIGAAATAPHPKPLRELQDEARRRRPAPVQ